MTDWIKPHHKARASELAANVNRVFSEHPEATGETYWQHLRFTATMSVRFLATTMVLLLHGLFPFLLVKTASTQIEKIYSIMRARVPKARRDVIDLDYQV